MSAVLKAKPAAGKPLFTHQKESVSFLKKSDIVFDTSDPGTGKTRVEVEDFAARRRRGGKCALVMATMACTICSAFNASACWSSRAWICCNGALRRLSSNTAVGSRLWRSSA